VEHIKTLGKQNLERFSEKIADAQNNYFTFLYHGATVPRGPRPRLHRGFMITFQLDTLHSVGLLWMSDQPDARTST